MDCFEVIYDMPIILLIYLLFINLLGFVLYGVDKAKSKSPSVEKLVTIGLTARQNWISAREAVASPSVCCCGWRAWAGE